MHRTTKTPISNSETIPNHGDTLISRDTMFGHAIPDRSITLSFSGGAPGTYVCNSQLGKRQKREMISL